MSATRAPGARQTAWTGGGRGNLPVVTTRSPYTFFHYRAQRWAGRKPMSIAHAVAHGAFGRACLYELDRPMVPHAHREGHLIFHVSGPVASVVVDGKTLPLTTRSATAISPWQPHYFAPIDRRRTNADARSLHPPGLVCRCEPHRLRDPALRPLDRRNERPHHPARLGNRAAARRPWRLRWLFRRPAQCPHPGGLRSNLAVDERG